MSQNASLLETHLLGSFALQEIFLSASFLNAVFLDKKFNIDVFCFSFNKLKVFHFLYLGTVSENQVVILTFFPLQMICLFSG